MPIAWLMLVLIKAVTLLARCFLASILPTFATIRFSGDSSRSSTTAASNRVTNSFISDTTFSLLAACVSKSCSSSPSVHVFLLRFSSISSSSSFFLLGSKQQ
eukprot:GHUV01029679.1.p1 GENE.GHUV01029679.1~~GHUV01029679.1.p1  ORF type:complete len:102 (-),score=18.29 GHUV01029679.1:292-597(-)